MREGIGSVLHGVDERDIYIDTFHARGAQILRSMPNQFGLTDKFRVADVDETHQIMREACRRIDADSLEIPQFAKVRIERLIETLDEIKSEGITPSSLVSAGGRFKNKTLQKRSAVHTSELQSLMRISYAAFFLKNTNTK